MPTSATIQVPRPGVTVARAATTRWMSAVARDAAIVGALLIQAAVILGFVEMSLGIGAEGQPGVGRDRPQPLMPAASAAPSLTPPLAPPAAPEPGSPPGPASNVKSDGPALFLARTNERRPLGARHLTAASIGPQLSESEG